MMLANGEEMELLPESLHFLGWGWWVLHVIAIAIVLYIGYAIGKSKGAKADAREKPAE